MNKDYQKAFKKLTLFFLLNPVPFKGQSYQKQNGPGTSDQLLFRLQIKSRKNVFISCILSDQIWYVNLMIFNDNVKPFLSYFKNSICKFMQANSWQIIPLPFHIQSGKCRRNQKNYKNLNILRKKEVVRWNNEIKNIFHSYLVAIIWPKSRRKL